MTLIGLSRRPCFQDIARKICRRFIFVEVWKHAKGRTRYPPAARTNPSDVLLRRNFTHMINGRNTPGQKLIRRLSDFASYEIRPWLVVPRIENLTAEPRRKRCVTIEGLGCAGQMHATDTIP